MLNFDIVLAKDVKTIGFLVSYGYHYVHYVPLSKLYLSPTSVMFKDEYHIQEKTWCEKKYIYWDRPYDETKVEVFTSLTIEEVSEVPEWLNKTPEKAEKEIADYKEKLRKKTWFYKMCHCLGKKEE
jgi:hypothetical protein